MITFGYVNGLEHFINGIVLVVLFVMKPYINLRHKLTNRNLRRHNLAFWVGVIQSQAVGLDLTTSNDVVEHLVLD